jgi:D-alanine--poly(phosphoribitol) ligase subunit 1
VTSYPHNARDRFDEIVATHGERVALRWSDTTSVTYAELDRLSNQVAHFLRQQGVEKGDRVCIRLDKQTLTYAIILACLKSGAPYFIVDPSNPRARVEHIVGRCMPKVVFSAKESPLELAHDRVLIVDKERPFELLSGVADSPFRAASDIVGSDAAYIMFTSGSTGFPKGAVMSHANLLGFIAWGRWQFAVTPDDVLTNVNPLYFDNSVFDMYVSLFNGAALVPFDAATIKDPYRTLERIDQLRCTIYFSVPSLLIYFQTLKLIVPGVAPTLRKIIFGGEGYPKTKLKELFDCFDGRTDLVNVYGPTECTCICSAYDISADDFRELDGYPPLGSLIPNFSYAILDADERAVAPGEIGELTLSGPCVGLGYFNEPELTAQAFRQNPLNRFFRESTYRTGDLVRYSPDDGKLYFVGRKDSQIKHQGYRIELGEIEHALGRIAGVDEAVALHSTRDGISTIIAVIATRRDLTATAVRKELAQFVPAYMVPARVEIVEQLPKNANGKIDRNLLKGRHA